MSLLDLLGGVRDALRVPRRRRSSDPVPPHQLASVAAVVEALRQLNDNLDAVDGVWHFNRMYLQVTELVE